MIALIFFSLHRKVFQRALHTQTQLAVDIECVFIGLFDKLCLCFNIASENDLFHVCECVWKEFVCNKPIIVWMAAHSNSIDWFHMDCCRACKKKITAFIIYLIECWWEYQWFNDAQSRWSTMCEHTPSNVIHLRMSVYILVFGVCNYCLPERPFRMPTTIMAVCLTLNCA